jgi:hypothetical protein
MTRANLRSLGHSKVFWPMLLLLLAGLGLATLYLADKAGAEVPIFTEIDLHAEFDTVSISLHSDTALDEMQISYLNKKSGNKPFFSPGGEFVWYLDSSNNRFTNGAQNGSQNTSLDAETPYSEMVEHENDIFESIRHAHSMEYGKNGKRRGALVVYANPTLTMDDSGTHDGAKPAIEAGYYVLRYKQHNTMESNGSVSSKLMFDSNVPATATAFDEKSYSFERPITGIVDAREAIVRAENEFFAYIMSLQDLAVLEKGIENISFDIYFYTPANLAVDCNLGLKPKEWVVCDEDGAPSIRVTSPNGGEVCLVGSVCRIEWKVVGDLLPPTVVYITNEEMGLDYSIGSTDSETFFDWNVPSVLPGLPMTTIVGSYKIAVRALYAEDKGVEDFSDSEFRIEESVVPALSVITPESSTIGFTGGRLTVRWQSEGIGELETIVIYIVNDPNIDTATPFQSVVSSNDGEEVFSIASSLQAGDYYIVVTHTGETGVTYDYSEKFRIVRIVVLPTLKVYHESFPESQEVVMGTTGCLHRCS